MRARHTTDDDLLIASYLDGTLTGSDLERFRARITANRSVMEIVESLHEVIGDDTCDDKFGQTPVHLLKRAIALYPEKQGLISIILSIAKQYISVIACPDELYAAQSGRGLLRTRRKFNGGIPKSGHGQSI